MSHILDIGAPPFRLHIVEAICRVRAASRRIRRPIRFTFNGHKLLVTRKTCVRSVQMAYYAAEDRRAAREKARLEAFLQTPDGRLHQARLEVVERNARELVASIVASIPQFNDPTCMELAEVLVDATSRMPMEFFTPIGDALVARGFVRSEFVGHDPSGFDGPKTVRYVMGQLIDLIADGIPIPDEIRAVIFMYRFGQTKEGR